jgi:hypothetical protein
MKTLLTDGGGFVGLALIACFPYNISSNKMGHQTGLSNGGSGSFV